MAVKTCQAEYDAYATIGSKHIEQLYTVNATTKALTAIADKNKVTDLLTAYGVASSTLDNLRQSGFHFYYDNASGKVTAASANPATQIQLDSKTTFSIDATTGVIELKAGV